MRLIHPTAWNGYSRKSVCTILHRCPAPGPGGRPEGALTAEAGAYMLWCGINMQGDE